MPDGLRNFLRWVFNNPYIEWAFYIVTITLSFFLFRRFFMGA